MRYRVRIETYFGYNEGTFDADSGNKAKYMMYNYLFTGKQRISFGQFLDYFRPTAVKVEDDALKTWCEYGNVFGYPNHLDYIGMMKEEENKDDQRKRRT